MENFRIYDTIDSTNKEALRLLASGSNLHGTAILARHQTDGRGQYGRSWYAGPESHLAMSIILQSTNMLLAELPLLAMKTSLAVARTIHSIDSRLFPLIKWPNDIYLGDRKIAGILIENSISSTKVQHSVIGIGMNVNEFQFPADLPNPVSLYLLTGKEYDIDAIAENLRNQILKLLDETHRNWKPEYDNLIYQKGKQNEFELNGQKISATILGVDDEGRLLLDMGDHLIKSYFSHEINWLKK